MFAQLVLAVACISAVVAQNKTLTGADDCAPGGNYQLCQNLWGAEFGVGNQNSTLISADGDIISWSTLWEWSTNKNKVKSYANVEHMTANGVQLANVATALTTWDWKFDVVDPDVRANVAYDIWLGKPESGRPASNTSDFEIMVWIARRGKVHPSGKQIEPEVSVANMNWEVWRSSKQNWQVISFVSLDGEIPNFSADLNEFFKYITANQGVADTEFIHSIQAGQEAFTGFANLVTNSYSVSLTETS